MERLLHLRGTSSSTAANGRISRLWQIVGLIALVIAGFWLRSLSPSKASRFVDWRPWAKTAAVTLYFSDGRFLFPVSRRMRANNELASAVLNALVAGPNTGSSLKKPIPSGIEIKSFELVGQVAHIDLLGALPDSGGQFDLAKAAIVETMTALPGVSSVALSVEGKPLVTSPTRMPLLYYGSANGLVALPVSTSGPRATLYAYLSGPGDPVLTGFPADVRLLDYDYDGGNHFLSLNFTYTPSIRNLALDKPERMRVVLLGLITTLTEFPEVRTVQLDFQGQTRLGLGQCSDLLRTPQPRPQLLNDERLLEP